MSFGEVLRIPEMRRLWAGQLVSIFGDFLALFAVMSVVSFRLHGTPAEMTLIQIFFLLPLAAVSPLAGVFVDRWDVKRTMIASDLIRAGLVVTLVIATGLPQILMVLFALSTVSSFFFPAQSVTLRTIVPKDGLMAANTLMQQAMQIMRIIGPVAAGVLVATLGEKFCYYLDGGSFLFSAAMIAGISVKREAAPAAKTTVGAVISEMKAGMRFIFTHATVSFVITSMAAGLFVMGCFGPLIAVYVRDFLHAGETLFGLVNSLMGVGMIVGGLLINRHGRTRSKSHLVIAGLLCIGVSSGLMVAFDNAWMTSAGTFALGFGVAFVVIPSQTLLQQETPADMMGRVSSSVMSVLIMAQLVGLVISGSLAAAVGVRQVFLGSGLVLVSIAAFGWWRLERPGD